MIVSDSTAGKLSNAHTEKQSETFENAVEGQSRDLVEKIICEVVVVDCASKGECRGGDSDARSMQNDVLDARTRELSNSGMEKRQSAAVEDGGVGITENPAGGQLQNSFEKVIDVVVVECPNKGEFREERDSNAREECRVCQEDNEEGLIDLGCHCRGALAKAHHSCITKWFQTRGSSQCEICRQIASNVAPLDPQARYWIWRVDPAYLNEERERNSCKIIWAALSILIGALLLDILVSITFGVSALPTNIIIGVIIVLGLGTALRVALDFFREWNVRRGVQTVEANISLGYHPAL